MNLMHLSQRLPRPLRRVLGRQSGAARPGPAAASTPRPAAGHDRVLQAPPLADELARAEAAAHEVAEALAARGCGWFDSSFELRQGLAVSECALDDWSAWAAERLDTVRLEPSSAQLQ